MRISDWSSDVFSSDLHDHLPDYAVEMNGDTVTFRNREALDTVEAIEAEPERPYIDPEGFHDAKSVAPGYDVYALYDQWVSWWIDSGRPELKSPRAAFIGFSIGQAAGRARGWQ